MNESEKDAKARNRKIAQNEAERQTIGDIRVSGWAIAVAIIIGLALVLEDPEPLPAPVRRVGGAHVKLGVSANRSESA